MFRGLNPPSSSTAGERTACDALVGQYLSALRALGLIRTERTTRALLESMFRGVEFKERRMLDIGGGTGIQSFYAAVMGAREVVCLEPEAAGSAKGVSGAFERIRAALPKLPISLDRRTIEQFGDPVGFDVILMNASINHIDEDACIRLLEDQKARAAFRRVFAHIGTLAPVGARLIIFDCARHNFFAALGLKNPIAPTIEWHKHQAPEVWSGLLEEAGFRDPKVSWQPLFRFGKLGELISGNKAAAYFLKSAFQLEMTKV
ncbi:MAG TPA: class I SAM-dependent methyltransferase [Burkholderiales bacterium]|nr:class I SAM-dependent methyltransferase [Burkholderiales bacterium]